MDPGVTQCPRCGTSFRVTEAHLAVAAGAVRCGSCMHIFNARDPWAGEPEPERAQPEQAAHLDDLDDALLIDDNTPLFGDDDSDRGSDSGSIFSSSDDDFGEFRQSIEPEAPEK